MTQCKSKKKSAARYAKPTTPNQLERKKSYAAKPCASEPAVLLSSPPKILVVDDDRRIRDSLSRALTLASYGVRTAKDGKQGLLLFEQEKPDIVLLDVRLPDIDGIELLRQLRTTNDSVEVLIITGHGDMNLVIEAMRAGASDFLSKPLQVDSLLSAIALATTRLAKKLQLRVQPPPQPALTIKAFGNLSLSVNRQVITQRAWPSSKARDVFKILLLHHRKLVRTEEFYQLLWPETQPESAAVGLYTAISQIRRLLEPNLCIAKRSRFVISHSGGYELHLGESELDYTYDVEQFLKLCADSRSTGSLSPLRQAIELYSDDFLKDDVLLTPIRDERERLRDLYLSALTKLGQAALAENHLEEALHYGQKIMQTDVLYEAGYEIQIQAYLRQGYVAKAMRLLESCRALYLEEIGQPEPVRLRQLLLKAGVRGK